MVWKAIRDSGFEITELGYGGAKEVDTYGKEWALRYRVPVKSFLPEWNLYGKQAGPMRNGAMAEWAEYLILVWNGRSSGSNDMREKAKLRKRPMYEVIWRAGVIQLEQHLSWEWA